MNWPNDADGDVFRRLSSEGFDFTKKHMVDFNVDFKSWPPPDSAILILKREYPSVKIYEPTAEDPGYIQFQVFQTLSYDFVVAVQGDVSDKMSPYGGGCESWGVLQE